MGISLDVKAPSRLRKYFARSLLFVLLLLILIAIYIAFTIRRSYPQTSGTLHLPGLKAPVTVYRDKFGIPQIYASSTHDLFLAQGYIHAQDRFWQMDFWRHIGSGRLAEMLGERTLETDRFLRTLGFARLGRVELQQTEPYALTILNNYAAGVNAYLHDHKGSALSLEYAILALRNSNYVPEAWEPLHSITWGKMMAWDLGENMDSEITRALLTKTLTRQQIEDLYPAYPSDHPVILPGYTGGRPSLAAEDAGRVFYPPRAPNGMKNLMKQAAGRVALLNELLGGRHEGIGSNNWVISGKRTATGKPVLCNDPHLGTQMPSIWYQIGLHCTPVTAECPVDVAGFSFAGVPGVIIGHNARVAWGFTNVGPDVMDLYIEKLNPQNPDQYEVNGKWVDMKTVDEQIQVANGVPVDLKVRYTRHGPIVSDTYDSLKDFGNHTSLDMPQRYAISLRWTALDPTSLFPAIWKMNIAQNWNDFREASRTFDVPSQNTVYADVDGNIGYQVPGRIPIRKNGDGRFPVPGWTDDYEWTSFIPFEELPSVFNPASGYIATANNPVTSEEYPHFIASDWDYGFRAQRIVKMIEAKSQLTITDIQAMQGDDFSEPADATLSVLMNISLNDPNLENARGLFKNWNRQERIDSAPAALYECFWKHLLSETFHDDLPEDLWPGGGGRYAFVVQRLLADPQSKWWDKRSTSQTETRDDILRSAFAAAVDELQQRFGRNQQTWKWGELHTVTYQNAVFGKTGVRWIDGLFNRGPYQTAGSGALVNATYWNARDSYEVTSLPSMRMLVDFSDFDRSLTVHAPGQSGHAYNKHYNDLADLWRNIEYYPMLWSSQKIRSQTAEVLHLEP